MGGRDGVVGKGRGYGWVDEGRCGVELRGWGYEGGGKEGG